MLVLTGNRKCHHRFAMTSLPVVEPHSKTGARLRIKYNRTTSVLNILLTPILLKSDALFSSGCVFFLGHPVNSVGSGKRFPKC